MRHTRLRIEGMTCAACASTVEQALSAVTGGRAQVDFASGLAEVEHSETLAAERLQAAVAAAGFTARVLAGEDEAETGGDGQDLHIAIVGSGSGAFAAALRATERGARVTLIEQGTLGGTCVNIGCVPSKILIRAAHIAWLSGHHGIEGLERHRPTLDNAARLRQQRARVEELRQAKYRSVLEANPAIELVEGRAVFEDAHTLRVALNRGGEQLVRADRILLATGARPLIPDIPGLDGTPFWTSTEALESEHLPRHLLVMGASVVALELAQAYHHLGVEVTLLARGRLLSREEPELGEALTALLRRQGMRVLLDCPVTAVRHTNGLFHLHTAHQGEVTGDALLVATGRRPNTDALALERAGVAADSGGRILVDEYLRTSQPHVFAVGDCTQQPQFVYVAAAAGTRAGINLTGGEARLDLSVVPRVIFTEPQVAAVGLGEVEARDQGLAVVSRTLELDQVPRALANFDTEGFIKLVAEEGSGRLLGAHLFCDQAGEVVQTAALAIRQGFTVMQLAEQLFPYLTWVEGLKLTAQTFERDVSQLSCCAG